MYIYIYINITSYINHYIICTLCKHIPDFVGQAGFQMVERVTKVGTLNKIFAVSKRNAYFVFRNRNRGQ